MLMMIQILVLMLTFAVFVFALALALALKLPLMKTRVMYLYPQYVVSLIYDLMVLDDRSCAHGLYCDDRDCYDHESESENEILISILTLVEFENEMN